MRLGIKNIHIYMYYCLLVIGFATMLWCWALNGNQPGGDRTANAVVISSWLVGLLAVGWHEEVLGDEGK